MLSESVTPVCQNIQHQERGGGVSNSTSHLWLLKGSDKQWVCDDGDSTHSLHSPALTTASWAGVVTS